MCSPGTSPVGAADRRAAPIAGRVRGMWRSSSVWKMLQQMKLAVLETAKSCGAVMLWGRPNGTAMVSPRRFARVNRAEEMHVPARGRRHFDLHWRKTKAQNWTRWAKFQEKPVHPIKLITRNHFPSSEGRGRISESSQGSLE